MQATAERTCQSLGALQAGQEKIIGRPEVVQGKLLEQLTQVTGHPKDAPAEASRPTLDAGRRTTEVYELLEMILLKVPRKTVLFSQRVSVCFRNVIITSLRLRSKLFFVPQRIASTSDAILLNPLIMQKFVLARLTLYFDMKMDRLVYGYRPGLQRIYCHFLMQSYDSGTGHTGIYSVFRSEIPEFLESAEDSIRRCSNPEEGPMIPTSLDSEEPSRTVQDLEEGSWKDMYLWQPCCALNWTFSIHIGRLYRSFYWIVKGDQNLDKLLATLPEMPSEAVGHNFTFTDPKVPVAFLVHEAGQYPSWSWKGEPREDTGATA